MRVKHLRCARCGRTFPRDVIRYRCECGDSIEVVYDYASAKGKISWEQLRARTFCHWRYRELYPPVAANNIVTMGEGGTPLIRSRHFGPSLGVKNLRFKLKGLNPIRKITSDTT